MKTPIGIAVCLAVSLLTSQKMLAQSGPYKLNINIPSIGARTGMVRIGLVSKAENFMAKSEIDTAVNVPAEGPVTVTIPNLKAGNYAVQIYHDVNNNKVLDREGGMPTEPFGFSNITVLMGPPTFEQAAFEVKEDTEIRIRLMER